MSKKFICLALALVLLCSFVFTGCGNNNNTDGAQADTEESSRAAMTISLWMPTDEKTTDEAREAVSAALNRLTQAKYNTAIDLHLIPRDEYQEVIDEKIDSVIVAREEREAAEEAERLRQKELKNQGIKEDPAAGTSDAEEQEGVYPAVADDQLDIFMVSGYDNYKRYIDEDIASQLNGELNSNSKLLKSYIYPHFFDIVDEFGIYGIPNNHPVGEYQYLLINKELVDKYDYDPDTFTTLIRCRNFIIDMGNQHLEGLVPLLGPVEPSGLSFWSVDGEWSVLGSQYGDDVAYNKEVLPDNVLTNGAYTNLYGMMKQLDELGYVGNGELEEGQYFAVGVVSGDGFDATKYEDDYYVKIHANPVCTEDDIFGAMFCVSTYTKDLSRSMEVITYLNTSSDIRTLLQYGVEGVHWEFEDESEETIRIISDDYGMNLLETGNVYMTYPGEGMPMSYWEYGKQQNLDSVSSPYIKFPGYVTDENREALERIAEFSKEIKAKLDACSYEDFTATVKELRTEVANNADVKSMLDNENENSVYYIYYTWHSDLYPF